MASNYVVLENPHKTESLRELAFAGDTVRLAGQIDYPEADSYVASFPLLFLLPHVGCQARDAYSHYAQLGLEAGYAVFRWDKRGTGRSGASGRGSATNDAILAYETAIEQPRIDTQRVVILAQVDGSMMLGSAFSYFARMLQPAGVILVGNMLDAQATTAIDSKLLIVQGGSDWNDWKHYARDAADAHNAFHSHGADYYVARNANRDLMVNQGGAGPFHFGARQHMSDWLLRV